MCKLKTNLVEILKKIAIKIPIFIYLIFCHFILIAQYEVNVNSSCFKRKQTFVAIYGNTTKYVYKVTDNQSVKVGLNTFEQSILVVFGYNIKPKLFFIETNKFQKGKLSLELKYPCKQREKILSLDAPDTYFNIHDGIIETQKFDLYSLKDKAGFAQLMSVIRSDMEGFYEHRKLPLEEKGFHSNDKSLQQKQIHLLGTSIYDLTKKLKMVEKQLHILNQKNRDNLSKLNLIRLQYDVLTKELVLEKLKRDIQYLKWKKSKEKYDAGKVKSEKYFQTEERLLKNHEESLEIAQLNRDNKAFELAIEKTKAQHDQDTSLVTLRLIDINLYKQKKNAHRLYQKHNELATNLDGRDRLIELANAQQMIAQQVQLEYDISKNVVKRWEIMDKGTGKYKTQIEQAKISLDKKWEEAWQADMAYLEHMWHLRAKPSIKGKFDDVLRHQSDLLVGNLNERGTLAELDPKDEKILNQKSKLAEVHQKAHYQIKIDKNGRKSYFKNGRPITKLTYNFETKRLFGEITKETLTETERKSLWDWFSTVILLK